MEDGRFLPSNPGAFKFAFLPFKGAEVVLTIEKKKENRSDKQNRTFYKLVVKAFCEYMGYRFNDERQKEFVKREILEAIGHYTIERGIDGKEKKVIKPTKGMDTREYAEMFETCQHLGAENGIVIPDPDPELAVSGKKRAP